MDKSERAEGVGRVRRCAVTHDTLPEAELIRFVADLDGVLFPDPAARAPGRGVWIRATQANLEQAIKKNAFGRSLKRDVKAPPNLTEMTVQALRTRCLALISIAKKAGAIVIGNDQVASFLRSQEPAWRLEASDGAADGRNKLNGLSLAWGGVPTAGCFTGAELGMALGRDVVIHALLAPSQIAQSWTDEIRRLSGFIPLVPENWPKDMSEGIAADLEFSLEDDTSISGVDDTKGADAGP
jgi:uncharacterized protein